MIQIKNHQTVMEEENKDKTILKGKRKLFPTLDQLKSCNRVSYLRHGLSSTTDKSSRQVVTSVTYSKINMDHCVIKQEIIHMDW